jgi:hypothetical protein
MVYVGQDSASVHTVVQQAISYRQIRRQDHLKLTTAILNGSDIQSSERFHINRLLDYVRAGQVRLVD